MSYSSTIIAVVGPTGSGKSTSMEYLDPANTFMINVGNKPLPFAKWKNKYRPFTTETPEGLKGNYFCPLVVQPNGEEWVDYVKISNLLRYISKNLPHIKHIILDDFQYIMSDEFMQRAYEKTWDKWSEMARHVYEVLVVSRRLREDLKVFVLTHDELEDGMIKKRKIKTLGKLLDEKITIEGLFTYVLFTHVEKTPSKETADYFFVTNTDGYTTAKSPKGCLPYKIPNNLLLVSEAIDKFEK